MKNQHSNVLKKELVTAGAKASEINDLTSIASALHHLSKSHAAQPKLNDRKLTRRFVFIAAGLTGLSGLTIGVAIVILAQTVLPGSWLYPVQKLSDHVAVSLHPEYRATVMMKRAEQVKVLVANHASSSDILATLSSYQAEAAAYRAISTNYAAFEYCKANLQQAAATASVTDRQAINAALVSLKAA